MFGKKIKQNVSDDIKLDFDLDDFGDGDMNFNSGPNTEKNRSPITRVATGVLSGAKDEVTSARFIKNGIKNTLPRGYGSALDLGDDIAGKLSDVYMDASKELAPVIKETKKAITKLIPKEASYLPKGIQDKINGWRDDSNYSASEANAREDSISANIGDIFKVQVQQAESHKAEERITGHIRDQVAQKRHTQLFDVNARSYVHLQSLDNYNKTITLGYQKKSLELQYRGLFALQDILKNTIESSKINAEKLEAIRHNTALPDFVKSTGKEFRDQILKQELVKAVQDGLYGNLKDKLTTISKNASGMIKNAARDFAGKAVGGIQQGMAMHDMAKDSGMDMLEMAGGVAGSMGADSIGATAGRWIGRKLQGSKYFNKINKIGNKLQYVADNKDEILQDVLDGKTDWMKNNNPENHAKRARVIDEQRQRLEWIDRGMLDKKDYTEFDKMYAEGSTWERAKISGKLMAASLSNNLKHGLANKFKEVTRGTGKSSFNLDTKDLGGANGSIRDMNSAYPFTRQTDISINKIIPSYLALILQELSFTRTGKKPALSKYDHITGKISTNKEIEKSIKNIIGNDEDKLKFNKSLDESVALLDREGTLKGNDAAIDKLKDIILEHGTSGNQLQTFLKTEKYRRMVGKYSKVLTPLLTSMARKNDGDGLDRKYFDDSVRNVTDSIKNPSSEIQELIKLGHGDLLVKMGIVKRETDSTGNKKYVLVDSAIKKHFRSKDMLPDRINGFKDGMNQGGIVRSFHAEGGMIGKENEVGGPVVSNAPLGQDSTSGQLMVGKNAILAGGEHVLTKAQVAALGGHMEVKKLANEAIKNAKDKINGVKKKVKEEWERPGNIELMNSAHKRYEGIKDTLMNGKAEKAMQLAAKMKLDPKTSDELAAFLSMNKFDQIKMVMTGFKNPKIAKLIPDLATLKAITNSKTTLGEFYEITKSSSDHMLQRSMDWSKKTFEGSHTGQIVKGHVDKASVKLAKQKERARKAYEENKAKATELLDESKSKAKELITQINESKAGEYYRDNLKDKVDKGTDIAKTGINTAKNAANTTVDILHAQLLKAKLSNPNIEVPSLAKMREKVSNSSPSDIKQYFNDLKEDIKNYVPESKAGKLAMNVGREYVDNAKFVYNTGKNIKNSLMDLIVPTDVYCKDEDGRLEYIPRLYKTKMLRGAYYSLGKPVTTPNDIKGPVRDLHDGNNIVISEEDLSRGIWNSEGRKIGNKFLDIFRGTGWTKKYKLGIIPKAALMVLKPFTWAIKKSMKTAPFVFKQYAKMGSFIADKVGSLFFTKITTKEQELAAHTATATTTSVGLLDSINQGIAKLGDALLHPKKEVVDETKDKDGFRKGSWQEQLKAKADAKRDAMLAKGKEIKDKTTDAAGKFLKDLGAKIGGMVMLLAAPLLKSINTLMTTGIGGLFKSILSNKDLITGAFDLLGSKIPGGKLGGKLLGKLGGKIAGSKLGGFAAEHLGLIKDGAVTVGKAAYGLGGKALGKLGAGAMAAGSSALGAAGAAKSLLKGAFSLKGGLIGATAGLAADYAFDKAIDKFGKDKYGNENGATTGLLKVGKTSASWAAWGAMLGPWGAAAGGLLGAGYGMYENWGTIFSKKNKRSPSLTGIRYAQYGFNFDSDKVSLGKMLQLENYLSKYVKEADGHADLADENVDLNVLMNIFGNDTTDQKQTELFKTWYQERFRPIYVAHLTIAKTITKAFKLNALGKLRGKDKITALEAVKGLSKAYGVHWVPVPNIEQYKMSSKSDIESLIDDAMAAAKLEKSNKEDKSGSKEGMFSKASSYISKLAGIDKKDSFLTKTMKVADILNPAGFIKNAVGAMFKSSSTGAGFDPAARNQGLGALEAIRMKAYGLKELDAGKVKALKQLEKVISDELTYSSFGGANWAGDIHKIIDKVGPLFGVTNDTDNKFSLQWLWWFTKRFMPVFLQFADGVHKFVNGNPTQLPNNALKVKDMVDISDMIMSTSGIWQMDYQLFEGVAPNSDPNSVKDNINWLKNNVKEEKIREQAAKLNPNGNNKAKANENSKPKPMTIPKDKTFNGEEKPKASGTLTMGGKAGNIGATPVADGPLLEGGEADAFIKYASKDVTIDGLQPAFAKLLRGAIEEYGKTTGNKVQINSGFRTFKQQQAEYLADPTKAAKPGNSQHEFGLAVDINTADLDAMDRLGILRKYGITRPVGAESWHSEPAGIQLDPIGSRDPSKAEPAIQAGIGKGGGGWGTMTKAGDPHDRNVNVAKQLLDSPSTPLDAKAKESYLASNKAPTVGTQAAQDNKITAATAKSGIDSIGSKGTISTPAPAVNDSKYLGEPKQDSALTGLNDSGNRKSNIIPVNFGQGGINNSGNTATGVTSNGADINPKDGDIDSVKTAIKNAAKLVGVDENIGLAISAIESDFRNVRASGASSNGYMQITDGTFGDLLKKYGSKYGLDPNTNSSNGKANIILGLQYIKDNMQALGASKSIVSVYLSYFLGPSGAAKFMKNYASNPNGIAATDFSSPAKANPGIFYNNGGKGPARTYQEIITELSNRFATKTSKYGIPYTPMPTTATGAIVRGQSVNPNTGAILSGGSTQPTPTNNVSRPSTFGGGPVSRPVTPSSVTKAYADNPLYQAPTTTAQSATNHLPGSSSKTDNILTEQLSVLKAIYKVLSNGAISTNKDDKEKDTSPATASATSSEGQMNPPYKAPEPVVSMTRMSSGTYRGRAA